MEYEIWDERKFLGMITQVKPSSKYFLDLMFGFEMRSDNEYIDFEKIPAPGNVAAPYVMPLAEGRPVYEQAARAGRFKPAYTKLKDVIDPLMGLVKRAGVGEALFNPAKLSVSERRELIRISMNQQHVSSIETLWELQAAQAVINGGYVVQGEDYPAQQIQFGRDPSHTIVKAPGARWGEPGVSILSDIQMGVDRMIDSPFGGMPTRITMSRPVWAVVQQDPEILKHMDRNIEGGSVTITRGITAADSEELKAYKVGELRVGGASGATIEMWVYYEKYQPARGAAEVPFLPLNQLVMTGSRNAYQGYRCYGMIIDPMHNYASVPISGRNWQTQGDPAVEYMLHQSSPLHVPINPNASLSMTVL